MIEWARYKYVLRWSHLILYTWLRTEFCVYVCMCELFMCLYEGKSGGGEEEKSGERGGEEGCWNHGGKKTHMKST